MLTFRRLSARPSRICSRAFSNTQAYQTQLPKERRPIKGAAVWAQTVPTQPRAGPLSNDEFQQYFEHGFILVNDFIPQEYLDNAKDDIRLLVDNLAHTLFSEGLIQDKHEGADFYERLTLLEKQYKGASVVLHKTGIVTDQIQRLWTYGPLLDVAQQILGPDIAAHPVWNLRCKVPDNEQATVPWHQDAAYLDPECYNTHQLTAWVPLLDATEETGCMEVVDGGHRAGNIATHTACAGDTWYVDLHPKVIAQECFDPPIESIDDRIVTCEVKEGSVLFLNNIIPHRSLQNFSKRIRWSFDLRWQNTHEANGFHGLKSCLPLRYGDDPNYVADWDAWGKVNRNELQQGKKLDTSTIVFGPWFDLWEVNHQNKHTRAFFQSENKRNFQR